MIKAVVFDLDDTLFIERDYIKSGFITVGKKIAHDFNNSETVNIKLLNETFEVSPVNVFNRTLDILNVNFKYNYINELVYEYRNHIPQIYLMEDAREIISYFRTKEYKLGIITDGYKETQIRKIDALNIKELFDCIIITDELGREFWKPHEKPYTIMKEKLNVEFCEIAYIGDNIQKDFITAKKLGIKTIRIKREGCTYKNETFSKEYLPDMQIEDLRELISLI